MSTARRWLAVVAVIGSLVPAVAWGQNFYGAVRGGPTITSDTHGGLPGGEGTIEFKTGFTGSAAVGYHFPLGLRAEGELGYLYTRLKRDGGVEVDGSIKNYLFMANGYFDVKIPALGPFIPFVGGGIGAARVNDDHDVVVRGPCSACGRPVPARIDVDEWRTAFAYQARGGMTYDVNQWLDLSLGYRYLHVDGGRVDHAFGRIKVGPQNNHSVELGFAVKF
jgi:opacity protein-like surface antigen